MNEVFEIYPDLYQSFINKYSNKHLLQLALHRCELFLQVNNIDIDNLIMLLSVNEITFEKLINISDIDLFTDLYHKSLEEKKIIFKKEQEGNTLKATTDMYTCRKCHKKECSYYELQIRSSDEPMTKFIKCCNCGYEWRQS